jgi:hypothetical protein
MDRTTLPTPDVAPRLRRKEPRVKAQEYSGPLGILAAGVLGLLLLCGVSAMAMGDLRRYIPVTLQPISIVELAVSNFETAAALTEQMVTVFVPTETLVPTGTPVPASFTPVPTETQRRFVTITPTFTRRARPTLTAVIPPTRTPTSRPTRTPTRIPPTATRTRTPIPPTLPPTLTPTDPPTVPPTDPPTDTPQPTDTTEPTTVPPTQPQDTPTTLPLATQAPTSANPVFVPSPTPGP